jgi:hypothetical protein
VFLLLVLGVILLYAFLTSDILYSQAQLQPQLTQKPTIALKISSPTAGQEVPVGELNITGTSTDNATTDCKVYVDWNDQKPFQNATATGPGGENDYSNWTFTYTKGYHLITNGTNELTSKLICYDGLTDLTKWNSVNITGVVRAENQTQQPLIVNNITSSGNGPVKVGSSPLKPEAEPASVPERASQLVPNKEAEEVDEREDDTLKEVIVEAEKDEVDEREDDTLKEVIVEAEKDEVDEREDDTLKEVIVEAGEEEVDEREDDTLKEVSDADPFKLPF